MNEWMNEWIDFQGDAMSFDVFLHAHDSTNNLSAVKNKKQNQRKRSEKIVTTTSLRHVVKNRMASSDFERSTNRFPRPEKASEVESLDAWLRENPVLALLLSRNLAAPSERRVLPIPQGIFSSPLFVFPYC